MAMTFPECTCETCPVHNGQIGNIRDLDSFRDNTWSLSPYDDCYDGPIRESDGDGLVERHGHLLISEGKNDGVNGRGRGELTDGQRIMYENITPRAKSIMVVVYEGTPPDGPVTDGYVYVNGKPDPKRRFKSIQDIHDFKSSWFQWANTH